MNDQELERRVTRWLHHEAPTGAPEALRHELAAISARRATAWSLAPLGRTGLLVAAAAMALVIGIASAFLLHRGPDVGARACTPELMDDAVAALSSVPGYSYRATGTAGSPGFVDIAAGPRLIDVAFEGGYQAPDRSFERGLPVKIDPSVPRRDIVNGGFGYMIRIGNRAWAKGTNEAADAPYQPLPAPSSNLASNLETPFGPANRLLALLQGADVGRVLAWTQPADISLSGSGGCVLRAEYVAGSTYSVEVRIDAMTALPLTIREVLDEGPYEGAGAGNPNNVHAGIDVTYQIDYATLPTIEPPPAQ